jgi:hypothetical protein
MSKYDALTRHLKAARGTEVRMDFAQIEGVLGFRLPMSARKHRPWWSNEAEGTHVQARAWVNAGFQAAEVDMGAERLVFVRLNAVEGGERPDGPDHPLWGVLKGTVKLAPGVDLTESVWDVAATDTSLDAVAGLLGDTAR